MNQTVKQKGIQEQILNLAETLVNTTQIPYQYFEVGSLLLINISSGPDGLQEYSVFKKCEETQMYYKFESLTVSWMRIEGLVKFFSDNEAKAVNEMECVLCSYLVRECKCSMRFQVPFHNFEMFKREFTEFAKRY